MKSSRAYASLYVPENGKTELDRIDKNFSRLVEDAYARKMLIYNDAVDVHVPIVQFPPIPITSNMKYPMNRLSCMSFIRSKQAVGVWETFYCRID